MHVPVHVKISIIVHSTRMEKTLLLVLSLSGLSLESADIVRKYHYVDAAQSWFQAQAHCRDKFADLAAVTTQEDSDRLLEALQGGESDAWIGLLDDLTKWLWTTQNMSFNNDKDYSNWEMEKLNHSDSRDKCALMEPSGAWLDLQCEEQHLSVCYDEELPDTYLLVNKSMGWKEAKKFCQAFHTDLVFVRNGSENERVASLLPARAWIGLHRVAWKKWSDQTRVGFTNWATAQPDPRERALRRCAAADADAATWTGDDCDLERPFVCYSIQQTREVQVKLKVLSEADLQHPAVNQQILEQLHVKLANNISEFVIHWTERDEQMFHKENDESGRVASPSDCAENVASKR